MNLIIVVEGTTDFTKIKQVGYKYCVKTCGFCVSRETINFLKSCSINRNIILLLDPDGPGRNIAKKIKHTDANDVSQYVAKSKKQTSEWMKENYDVIIFLLFTTIVGASIFGSDGAVAGFLIGLFILGLAYLHGH